MSGFFRVGLAAAFLFRADPAFAHLPIEGVGGFYGGLLHPILVPAHALSVVALGLFIGRQRERRIPSSIFAVALIAGLIAIARAVEAPVGNVMLANTALLGGLVAMAWRTAAAARMAFGRRRRRDARARFAAAGDHRSRKRTSCLPAPRLEPASRSRWSAR